MDKQSAENDIIDWNEEQFNDISNPSHNSESNGT
jgi:hypothetical protein